jgi:hypothetical protein
LLKAESSRATADLGAPPVFADLLRERCVALLQRRRLRGLSGRTGHLQVGAARGEFLDHALPAEQRAMFVVYMAPLCCGVEDCRFPGPEYCEGWCIAEIN